MVTYVSCSPCDQEILDQSFVEACGPSDCEPLFGQNDEWPTSKDEVVQISSSREGLRFNVTRHKAIDTVKFFYEECHVNGTLFADPETKYQKILGFGSTLTDASCVNVDDLSNQLKEKLLTDYFGLEQGIGLNLLRIPVGSTRFSYSNYVLDQFDVNQPMVDLSAYDLDHRIPLIKDAQRIAGKLKDRLKLIAYSQTAPARMKENNKLVHGGRLRKENVNQYANYLLGFIEAYRELDLKIWSLVVSDSPSSVNSKSANDSLDYNSMSMRPSEVIELIKDLSDEEKKKITRDIRLPRLMIMGDKLSYIPYWTDRVLSPKAQIQSKISGLAYKCQSNEPSTYDNLVYHMRRNPTKYLLAIEGTPNGPMKLGSWQYAENYLNEMVKNLEFGSVGWIDSNLALNLEGGPTVSGPIRAWDAPMIVDKRRASYYRNPMFYAIGHLSRYVRPGSIRVRVDFFSAAQNYARQHIGFVTPQNYLVVLVMNNNIGPIAINIGINTRTKVEALLETKSFNTFLFKL